MQNLGRVRWAVQTVFAVLSLWIGYEFVRFYGQAMGSGEIAATRPPGVEAFLPISALLALKRFLLTGLWDDVHPAGLTLLIAFLVGALVARRAFCSWICPIGFASRLLDVIRARLLRLPPRWRRPVILGRAVPLPKYLLLGFFIWIALSMSVNAIDNFLMQSFNLAADAAMLRFFVNMSVAGMLIVGLLVAYSLVVRHGWCRTICPYGALLGLVGFLSPVRIVRDTAACKNCGACTRACPSGIRVSDATVVHSLECTACLSCVESCKFDHALSVRSHWGHRLRPWAWPATAVVLFVAAYGLAEATGHWRSKVGADDFRAAYQDTLPPG